MISVLKSCGQSVAGCRYFSLDHVTTCCTLCIHSFVVVFLAIKQDKNVNYFIIWVSSLQSEGLSLVWIRGRVGSGGLLSSSDLLNQHQWGTLAVFKLQPTCFLISLTVMRWLWPTGTLQSFQNSTFTSLQQVCDRPATPSLISTSKTQEMSSLRYREKSL